MKVSTQGNKLTEKQIENNILEFLATFKDGLVCNIEISGRPVRTGGFTRLIPFQSRFHRKGMSDILFWYQGKCFAFEVKTVSEYNWYQKKKELIKKTPIENIKSIKQQRFKQQQTFIDDIISSGNFGDFVCSIKQVSDIIKNSST